MSERDEIGPVLPPRGVIYAQAREAVTLGLRAMEMAMAGPRCDLAAAQRQLDRLRAVLGSELAGGN